MFLNIAHAQIIELPSNFAANVASTTGSFLASAGISGYITLILGTLLAITVLSILISTFFHR